MAGLVGLLLAAGFVWNLSVAVSFSDSETTWRAGPLAVGTYLADLTGGGCVFASNFSYPVVALVSGCEGMHLSLERLEAVAERVGLRSDARRFLVIAHSGATSLGPEWQLSRLKTPGGEEWYIYELQSG